MAGAAAHRGWAALGSVALTVVQIVVFTVWPPPQTVPEILALMSRAPLLAVVSMDGLYLINNLPVVLVYLALAVCLWAVSRSAVVVVVALGLVQMAAYFASNPAVEMLTLGHAYDGAAPGGRAIIEGAGQVLLARWTGSAFLVYYFLGALVLVTLAWLLRRSTLFPASAPWWALVAGILMVVPSSFGLVGMIVALASLVPWSVLCIILGIRLLRLARP